MNVLIVEDETAAFENLVEILHEIDSTIKISANTESISQTVKWLNTNQAPDLIFMDIHLSDGSAFSIFDSIDIETPIIFTTAYDQYAINAFKVNSIDYLLKPIKIEELKCALEKFHKWTKKDVIEYLKQMSQLNTSTAYKDKLLVPVKDKLIPVDVPNVSFFYSTERNTSIYTKNGKQFPFPRSLDKIAEGLNPADFIRANKQFILARNSVKNITIWFDNRLLITTDIEPPERIYISKNKASEFKAWFIREI